MLKNSDIKLSVAMCSFNGGKFIAKQIESILNQTISVDELIICDDNSNDLTTEILNNFKSKYPNKITLVMNENSLGTISNFEKCIRLTTGDLIFLADQDDIWLKDKVEKMINFFRAEPDCQLLFSDGSLIDENGIPLQGTLWEKWNFTHEVQNIWSNNNNAFRELILNRNKITGATVCFKKSLKEIGLPILMPLGYWHDAWFGLHAAAIGGLYFMKDQLIEYRIHNNQQIGTGKFVDSTMLEKNNVNHITKSKFFKSFRRLYPDKKSLIPSTNFFKRFL